MFIYLLSSVVSSVVLISGDNPVIDTDEDDLQDEVDRITGMGNPVDEFLNSEQFTSVDPTTDEVL